MHHLCSIIGVLRIESGDDMGTPDTLHIKNGIACKICGTKNLSFQSHSFADIMMNYYPGDLLETNVVSGVIETDLFCSNYQNHPPESYTGKREFQHVYIVIWHQIFIDILESKELALDKLDKIGIGDIVLLLQDLQEDRRKYRNNYWHVLNTVDNYARYLDLPEDEQNRIKNLSNEQNHSTSKKGLSHLEFLSYHSLYSMFK